MAAYAALLSLAQTTDLYGNLQTIVFLTNCQENFRTIHDSAIILLSFLEDFAQKARRWEGKIRDVAQEIEDTIELFLWEKFQSPHNYINILVLENKLRIANMEIGCIVVDIMDERPASASASSPSRFAPAVAAASLPSRSVPAGNPEVIGLDGDLYVIKDRLCGVTSHLEAIPIVGMGGIGKTTLARIAYDDPLIVGHFPFRAWVTVSQVYDPYELKKTLFRQLVNHEIYLGRQIDESEMTTKVFQSLKGRRYLIVMDDIWSQEVWDDVRNIFPDDGNGSRIMFTTRLLDIATYPHSASPVFQMRFLNHDQGWELLRTNVLLNSESQSDLADVGKEIVRRCAGLPLAIVLVAGVLSPVDKTRATWVEIAQQLVVDGKSEEILSLSYINLPHHLRPCFLFIGCFKEDAEIYASRLIRLWVAEGFIKHHNGRSISLEEEAHKYLEDLVKRNLVIVTKKNTSGKIKKCKLHDMTRELCIRKALEEKFLHVDDKRALPPGMINVRHISSRYIDYVYGPTIRTILYFQHWGSQSELTSWRRFRLLRVLDVIYENHKEIPSEVLLHLFYLRYLAIIVHLKIPSSISNLLNLQTLIIGPKFPQWEKEWGPVTFVSHYTLPLQIWQMSQLRHIVFKNNPYTLPLPPVQSNPPLLNLQTLSLVEDLVLNENILQMIPNVKKLGLVYTSKQCYNLHLLEHLHQLEKLEVRVAGHYEIWWKEQNFTFPSSLRKLSLVGGRFPFEDMTILGSLPNLEVLKLHDYATDGDTWETADEDFPSLKFLSIDKSSLQHWITGSRPFPRLNRLVLSRMWNLRKIPEGIAEISTLELIQLRFAKDTLGESAMKIKEAQHSYGNSDFQVQNSLGWGMDCGTSLEEKYKARAKKKDKARAEQEKAKAELEKGYQYSIASLEELQMMVEEGTLFDRGSS